MKFRSFVPALAALTLLIAAPGCKEDEPAPQESAPSETDVNIQVDEDGGSVGVEHQDESGNDVNVEVETSDSETDESGGQ